MTLRVPSAAFILAAGEERDAILSERHTKGPRHASLVCQACQSSQDCIGAAKSMATACVPSINAAGSKGGSFSLQLRSAHLLAC